MLLYKIMGVICTSFFSFFFKMKVEGVENIPKEGAVIICPNHISNLDPPLVATAMKTVRPIRYMAKAELFKYKWVAAFLYQLGAFPISRGNSDRHAVRTGTDILKEGECLGIFPEGRRKKTGTVQDVYVGAAMFALKYNAQVIPVGIKGDFKWFQPMTVSFGKPVNINKYRNEKTSSEDAKEAMDLIVKQMNELLK